MKKQLLEKFNEYSSISYSQDYIDIADISNGYVFLNDGSIVKILEILPINYDEKPDETKDAIADIFGLSFKRFPRNGQLKIMTAKANLDSFVKKFEEQIKKETEPKVVDRMIDYLDHVKRLQSSNSSKKRFFYIFSYEGDVEEKKSSNFEDILFEMNQQMEIIAESFAQTGNYVLNADDDNTYEAEILYSFFNPYSRDTEGLQTRIKSVTNASTALARKGINKTPLTVDYVAPRGIEMLPNDHMLMDGVYHTFLALRDTSFPTQTSVGWLRTFLREDPTCDIDIHIHETYKETTEYMLNRATHIRRGSALGIDNNDKQNELLEKANNSEYMLDLLQKNDEDLYQVTIIITLKASSRKELISKKGKFLKNMRANSYYFDDCFLQTQNYFKMTMPLNYKVQSILKANSRNMTNSSLSTLFCMTTYEMFDPNGWVLGKLSKNDTLFSYDSFNTRIVSNSMITLCGVIGSGKTFTELMLASRMRMNGIKVYFVLPLKGHEYKDNVDSLGGVYVPLFPGSKACVNIMEIRPEAKIAVTEEDDSEVTTSLNASLKAKKIESIITWITLLINRELPYEVEGELNVAISRVYDRFGITDDNNSIWEDFGRTKLKKMPTISDLRRETMTNPMLRNIDSVLKAWTEGNCANMDGQTNIDLSKKVIAFDVDEDKIGTRFLAAFMYIAFDICYAGCKENLDEKCGVFLDESWKFLDIPSCGQQIRKMVKILRAYHTAVVNATQSIEDYTRNESGRAILSMSDTKIFLRCGREEINALSSSIDLSPENKRDILSLPRGNGFIAFNTERMMIHFQASDWEEELYTPGADAKKRIRERRLVNQGLKNV